MLFVQVMIPEDRADGANSLSGDVTVRIDTSSGGNECNPFGGSEITLDVTGSAVIQIGDDGQEGYFLAQDQVGDSSGDGLGLDVSEPIAFEFIPLPGKTGLDSAADSVDVLDDFIAFVSEQGGSTRFRKTASLIGVPVEGGKELPSFSDFGANFLYIELQLFFIGAFLSQTVAETTAGYSLDVFRIETDGAVMDSQVKAGDILGEELAVAVKDFAANAG